MRQPRFALWGGGFRSLLGVQCPDAEGEVNNVEDPDADQHDPAHGHLTHHSKANAHEQRHCHHDTDLGFPGHTLALDVAFQIILP